MHVFIQSNAQIARNKVTVKKLPSPPHPHPHPHPHPVPSISFFQFFTLPPPSSPIFGKQKKTINTTTTNKNLLNPSLSRSKMAQTLSLLFLSLLLFLYTTSTHSFSSTHNNLFKSPQTRAEALIRQLNLFPRHAVNIAGNSSSGETPAIEEKSFMFPSLVGPGNNSIQDLGHHAGYYRIPHTVDARYV